MRHDIPSPRSVLSENLKALMRAHPDLGTIKKVAEASGSALSNGKVGRIYAASHTTDIDTLQHLASVFDLEPWQLLVAGLNPAAVPRLADATVLNQILDAVSRQSAQSADKSLPPAHTHPVQTKQRRTVGPALKEALIDGKEKSEAGKPGRVSKPKARRGP